MNGVMQLSLEKANFGMSEAAYMHLCTLALSAILKIAKMYPSPAHNSRLASFLTKDVVHCSAYLTWPKCPQEK